MMVLGRRWTLYLLAAVVVLGLTILAWSYPDYLCLGAAALLGLGGIEGARRVTRASEPGTTPEDADVIQRVQGARERVREAGGASTMPQGDAEPAEAVQAMREALDAAGVDRRER